MAVVDVSGMFLLDVADKGFASVVGIVGLVCLYIERCMTNEDIHIGEFAELLSGAEVV